MKPFLFKALSWLSFATILGISTLQAQTYTYTLNGSPINTTGWTMGGNASNASTHISLNNNTTNQNGYIYYTVPQNLNSACDFFTIEFSYQIQTTPGVQPADGLAFWYIANPPSSFVAGGGIGMPTLMNGFALIFDTYDNNSGTPVINANPLITLRQFTNDGYTEGVMNGLLGTELTAQNQIIDGNWHTAKIKYESGVISVFLDGATTPQISAPMVLTNATGYFGFSASTGALYEMHAIKDVIISGGQQPDPVTVTDAAYCQGEPATVLSAVGNLPNPVYRWYTVPVGGTPTMTAPMPNTNVPGTQTWYVTQSNVGCPIESQRVPVTVTVHPKPNLYINVDTAKVCMGSEVSLLCTGASTVTWTPNQNSSAPNDLNTVVNPNISTVYRAVGSNQFGCKDTAFATVVVYPTDSVNIYKTIDEGEYYTFFNKKLWNPGVYKSKQLTEHGCDSMVVLHLNVDYKDKRVVFPNAFTPNGDGKNDRFGPIINYPNLVNIDKFDIVNRWGQIIYSTYGIAANSGWDGTINGKNADPGVYYYYSLIKINEEVKEYKGEIHLIR
jgi:gliding motility-associated-like protein